MTPCTSESGSGDDEGTFSGTTSEHGFMRGGGHHGSIEVVDVVFEKAVGMFGVCLYYKYMVQYFIAV